MNPSFFKAPRRGGYILMEVMLATAIFAMAGVTLAVLLSEAISAGLRTQHETRIVWGLESRLNQARLARLQPGTSVSEPDAGGVTYETAISQLNMKNLLNQPLPAMYNITVTARWKEENEDMDLAAQTYVYQP